MIDKKEAVSRLKWFRDYNEEEYCGGDRVEINGEWYYKIDDRDLEAFDEAIKALEQEPCEDCVSRQAVDELSKELVHTTRDKADFLCNFWEGLSKLPPVNPQSNTGSRLDSC